MIFKKEIEREGITFLIETHKSGGNFLLYLLYLAIIYEAADYVFAGNLLVACLWTGIGLMPLAIRSIGWIKNEASSSGRYEIGTLITFTLVVVELAVWFFALEESCTAMYWFYYLGSYPSPEFSMCAAVIGIIIVWFASQVMSGSVYRQIVTEENNGLFPRQNSTSLRPLGETF